MSVAQTKSELRKHLRHARRALSQSQQQLAAHAIVPICQTLMRPQQVKRIALYWAMDGELDLKPLIEDCWRRNIEVYLPVLHHFKPTLWFARYQPNSEMYNNRFGIPEPVLDSPIRPWQLNCVLFPLVGFDEQGGRLGMGGGFYDRTFARMQTWPKKPALYGIAHECQKVEKIPLEAWDISVQGIISDRGFYHAETR